MTRYIASRLIQAFIVMLGVATIVFLLMRMTGDPVRLLLPDNASEAEIGRVRHLLGLDRPIWEQYLGYLGQLVQGDLGQSIRLGAPAMDLLLARVWPTLQLTLAALLVSLLIALPLGTLSALKRDSPIDGLSAFVALLGQCIPTFWLGIMLISVFAVNLRLLPALGIGSPAHLVLPAITVGAYSAALTTRMLRSSLLDVLDEDFIRTARAKGLRERMVLLRHMGPHAIIPVVTVVALQMGYTLSGTIVAETVFNYPGMGLLLIQAIYGRDFTLVQGFVIMLALVIVIINLLVDVLHFHIDPRVRR